MLNLCCTHRFEHPVVSMTIVRWFAAVKTAIRSQNENKKIHYEFFSTAANDSGSAQLFLTQAKTTSLVEIRITRGDDKHKKKAKQIATNLKIDFNKLIIPTVGTLLVVAKVSRPLKVIRTESLDDDFAKQIKDVYPFALPLEVIQWFTPDNAVRGTDRRVSHGMSQFGFAQDGLPTAHLYL